MGNVTRIRACCRDVQGAQQAALHAHRAWQDSVQVFQRRLCARFEGFEDCWKPFEVAVHQLRHGVASIAMAVEEPVVGKAADGVLAALAFPQQQLQGAANDCGVPALLAAAVSRRGLGGALTRAAVSRLNLWIRHAGPLDPSATRVGLASLRAIFSEWSARDEQRSQAGAGAGESDVDDKRVDYSAVDDNAFKPVGGDDAPLVSAQAMFGEYHKEFEDAIRPVDRDGDGDVHPTTAVVATAVDDAVFADTTALHDLHALIFSPAVSQARDIAVARDAVLDAARDASIAVLPSLAGLSTCEGAQSGGADGFVMLLLRDIAAVHAEAEDTESAADLMKPSVQEAARAIKPVAEIMARVQGMLQQWPDNAQLVVIMKVRVEGCKMRVVRLRISGRAHALL